MATNEMARAMGMWNYAENRPFTNSERAFNRAWLKPRAMTSPPVVVGLDMASGPDMTCEAVRDPVTGKLTIAAPRT